MICQNCKQPAEIGATFCGNCGQRLPDATATTQAPQPAQPQQAPTATAQSPQPAQATAPGPAPQPTSLPTTVPAYAVENPAAEKGETKALLSVLFGVTGIIGALFMALIGLVLGITGVVLGTLSRSSTKRGMSNAGLVLSSLAILAGLAVWTYAIKHDPRFQEQPTKSSDKPAAPAISGAELSTPCYSLGFVDKLNISNHIDSCDMSAFNGKTISTSTNAYKVYANKTTATAKADFIATSKQSLEKDVKTNLPGFEIQDQQEGEFADSPAYFVTAYDKKNNISIVEAAVLHKVDNGENVFILVHAVNEDSVDLDVMEAQWQWK